VEETGGAGEKQEQTMPIVSLDKAEAGMTLSKPAVNEFGVVLLDAGAKLTGHLITRLLRADISSVYIVGAPDRAKIQELLTQLQERFEKTRNEPHMALLEEIVAEHIEECHAA
jgi:hypothetical protein